jgi:hypothetical protein
MMGQTDTEEPNSGKVIVKGPKANKKRRRMSLGVIREAKSKENVGEGSMVGNAKHKRERSKSPNKKRGSDPVNNQNESGDLREEIYMNDSGKNSSEPILGFKETETIYFYDPGAIEEKLKAVPKVPRGINKFGLKNDLKENSLEDQENKNNEESIVHLGSEGIKTIQRNQNSSLQSGLSLARNESQRRELHRSNTGNSSSVFLSPRTGNTDFLNEMTDLEDEVGVQRRNDALGSHPMIPFSENRGLNIGASRRLSVENGDKSEE